ncbi:hypothetical protein V8E55_011957 [Tylopilus felleus]
MVGNFHGFESLFTLPRPQATSFNVFDVVDAVQTLNANRCTHMDEPIRPCTLHISTHYVRPSQTWTWTTKEPGMKNVGRPCKNVMMPMSESSNAACTETENERNSNKNKRTYTYCCSAKCKGQGFLEVLTVIFFSPGMSGLPGTLELCIQKFWWDKHSGSAVVKELLKYWPCHAQPAVFQQTTTQTTTLQPFLARNPQHQQTSHHLARTGQPLQDFQRFQKGPPLASSGQREFQSSRVPDQ